MMTNNRLSKSESSVSNSYVVRIYRRDRRNRDKIIGTVENIHTGKTDSFKNARTLVQILTHPSGQLPESKHSSRSDG